ncbi:MAG: hypothetical protein M0P71_02815 [Melioribacteraceae bacterium]|nr:hypothetical protein [Melioribacteraceae bacterium]
MIKREELYIYVLVALTSMALLLMRLKGLNDINYYTPIFIITSLFYLIIVWLLHRNDFDFHRLFFLLGIGIIFRIFLLEVNPIGSDDVFRYIWDGKVQANGINPYLYAPNNPALNFLHTATLPSLINFPNMPTIYFPLSEILFFIAYLIGGESINGIKFLIILFEFGTIFLIFKYLRENNHSIKYALLYVLCPLPIFQFIIDSHVDIFGIYFTALFFYLYFGNKKLGAFAALGLSIAIKPTIGLFLPILFLHEETIKEKLKSILIPITVISILFIPYIFNANPFEALILFSKNWMYNGFIFDIINIMLRNNQESRMISGGIFLFSYIVLLFANYDIKDKLYFSVILLLIFSPVVHPWYVLWLVVLLPFVPKWSGIVFAATLSLTSFTLLSYKNYGVWVEYKWLVMLEYLPVVILLILEMKRGIRKPYFINHLRKIFS